MHPRDNCTLKLDRAQLHLEFIEKTIGDFLNPHPYGGRVETSKEPDGWDRVTLIAVVSREPDPAWGLVIGECLFNLRSALDHLMRHLGEVNGGGDFRGTQFPIFRDKPRFFERDNGRLKRGSGLYQMRLASRPAQALIESLQPYHRRQNAISHPLWVLSDLHIWDKHNALLPVLVNTLDNQFRSTDAVGVEVGETTFHEGRVEDGTPLASIRIRRRPDAGPNAKVNMKGETTFRIAFDNAGAATGEEAVVVLQTVVAFVKARVFPLFDACFPA